MNHMYTSLKIKKAITSPSVLPFEIATSTIYSPAFPETYLSYPYLGKLIHVMRFLAVPRVFETKRLRKYISRKLLRPLLS